MTRKKWTDKLYYRHTGYPGGLAGGSLRTSTPPTVNVLPLRKASVSAFTRKVSHAGIVLTWVVCVFSMTRLPGDAHGAGAPRPRPHLRAAQGGAPLTTPPVPSQYPFRTPQYPLITPSLPPQYLLSIPSVPLTIPSIPPHNPSQPPHYPLTTPHYPL